MTTLLVQIDDKTLPLRSCHWVLFGPDGCAHGSEYGDGALDAERAHKNFTPRQRDRDRQTRQGYRVELLTKQQWREQAGPCFYGKCQHHDHKRSTAKADLKAHQDSGHLTAHGPTQRRRYRTAKQAAS